MGSDELRASLVGAKGRNDDAYLIIGAVSGIGEARVKKIAEGVEPTATELAQLGTLA